LPRPMSRSRSESKMTIEFAHLRHQGIDFAVFAADARSATNRARSQLLGELVVAARRQGLKIDKAALAFRSGGRTEFYGTRDLVEFLSHIGVPRWTHTLRV
jgi:hypothetical protein